MLQQACERYRRCGLSSVLRRIVRREPFGGVVLEAEFKSFLCQKPADTREKVLGLGRCAMQGMHFYPYFGAIRYRWMRCPGELAGLYER
jgi:hypothetical protein